MWMCFCVMMCRFVFLMIVLILLVRLCWVVFGLMIEKVCLVMGWLSL